MYVCFRAAVQSAKPKLADSVDCHPVTVLFAVTHFDMFGAEVFHTVSLPQIVSFVALLLLFTALSME